MKFTVEIEDFYLDEDSDIENALKTYIIREVVDQINSLIKERVEKQITMEVREVIEKNLYKKITSSIEDAMISESMPSRKDSKTLLTLKEYVKECINYNSGWDSFEENIKKIAKSFSDEMKQRYDLLFASHIVSKLSENGLLKDDVAKRLCEGKK